jgi:hypothetical protein
VTESPDLTDEQLELAQKLGDGAHPRSLVDELSSTVDEEMCAEMRRAFKDGDRLRYMVADEFDFDRDTVWRHALGECGHDIEESPAERVGTGGYIG